MLWLAEHHFSNYCLCASPLMMVAHCASITQKIKLGTAVTVLSSDDPVRVHERFETDGIEFAFPTQTILLASSATAE